MDLRHSHPESTYECCNGLCYQVLPSMFPWILVNSSSNWDFYYIYWLITWNMHVHMCSCVCMCQSSHVHVSYACMCTAEIDIGVFLDCSPLCLPRWGLSLNLELIYLASSVSHVVHGTPCLCFPSAEVAEELSFLCRSEFLSSHLFDKHFIHWDIFSSPSILNYYK